MASLRPRSVEFQSSWDANFRSQLQSLFNSSHSSESTLSALRLYTHTYELCIAFPENHTMRLLKNIGQLFFDSVINMRQKILDSGTSVANESTVLRAYVSEWNRFMTAFKAINGVCRYLNKCLKSNYETAQYPNGSSNLESSSAGLHFQPVIVQLGNSRSEKIELRVESIEDVAMTVWGNLMLRFFREKGDNLLIKSFLSELRPGKDSDKNLLKQFVESYQYCGDSSLLAATELDSKIYFSKVSRHFLEQNDSSKFVLFVTEQLTLESERIKFLWSSDLEAVNILMKVCEIELIDFYKSILQGEFERILQVERASDVKVLFSLLKKNESTSHALQQSLSGLIGKEFESVSSTSNVVENVIEIYAKFVIFINDAFENDLKMVNALEDSIQILVNSKVKSFWNFFSEFIDEKLKSSNPISPHFLKFIGLFAIKSDSFEAFMTDFKEKLAHRLIHHSFDLNAEMGIIDALKHTGKLTPEQNCHLNRMLADYGDKSEEVLVLTAHAWPSSCNPELMNDAIFPESLKSIMSEFEAEYRSSHCGRKLQWCPQLITCQTKNECLMTLLQCLIIDSLPCLENVDEISCKIGVPASDVSKALKPLKENFIVVSNSSSNMLEFTELTNGLNLIPLDKDEDDVGVFAKSKISQENSSTMADQDSSAKLCRSFVLQSLVASILKQKRQVSPAELKKIVSSNAVNMKFGHSFNPSLDDLSDAVNNLIGKGYVEFNSQDNLYIYVP